MPPDTVATVSLGISVGALVVALGAAIVAAIQVRISSFTAGGTQFTDAIGLLQSEEARLARRMLYAISEKPYVDWTVEERATAEKVCSTYLQVAFMLRNSYLPLDRFLPYTDRTVADCYAIAQPLILERRQQEDRPSLHVHFEWLARREELFYRRRQWWQKHSFRRLVSKTQDFAVGRNVTPTFPRPPSDADDHYSDSEPI
jgi:hypothetical protein